MSHYHRRRSDPPQVMYRDHTSVPNWVMSLAKLIVIGLVGYAAKTLHDLDRGMNAAHWRLTRIERELGLPPITEEEPAWPFAAYAATVDDTEAPQ